MSGNGTSRKWCHVHVESETRGIRDIGDRTNLISTRRSLRPGRRTTQLRCAATTSSPLWASTSKRSRITLRSTRATAGLVPAIHAAVPQCFSTWMPGSSPGTTSEHLVPHLFVIAGLVPTIHAAVPQDFSMDARVKPGHDETSGIAIGSRRRGSCVP